MGKAKLIKSTGSTKSNPVGKWYIHDEIKPFIQGIEAGDLDEEQVSGTLISGVPTPWARPKLFWFAFDYIQHQDTNIKTSGLFSFYKTLIAEWRGLLAVIALYPDRVSFSAPISLADSSNIPDYFGKMLLEEKNYWLCLQKKHIDPNTTPFIQLIKYNGQLIGGTSPYSIFFPGVEYPDLKGASDIPWYTKGKFSDPMDYIRNDKDKVQKLYLFIKNVNVNFGQFERSQEDDDKYHPDYSGLKQILRSWQIEFERGFSGLQSNGTVAKYKNLEAPFAILLESNQKVFLLSTGDITFREPEDKTLIKAVLSDLQNILKDDKKIIGWYESSDFKHPLSSAAVYYLKVADPSDKENPVKYFSLPLSLEGIQLFGQRLKVMVSHTDPKFDMVGNINEQGKLNVDLTVNIDNEPYKLNSKEYDIEWASNGRKIIMWPDFVSDKWDAYYLYSEYPSNISGMKFIPFYKNCADSQKQILKVTRTEGLGTKDYVVYADSDEDMKSEAKLDITELVKYPVGKVSEDKHKYEVTRSNMPIAGLEIRIDIAGHSKSAGYLIVKSPDDDSMKDHKIEDFTTKKPEAKAIVGIDFGSNNSCVYYREDGSTEAKPLLFNNHRLALVGLDSDSNSLAERDELLFFSNESTPNGQIKSWLHDPVSEEYTKEAYKDKEISGGVAVNEKNIFVKKMDRMTIDTQAGVLHYNMKWVSEISKKTAFLKSVWLSVCADLFVKQLAPKEIHWSYPSAMSSTDLSQYRNIYNAQLPNLTPILDGNCNRIIPKTTLEQTESESVCKYALIKNYGLTNDAMFIGIDVGGSTSDLLLLAQDISNMNKATLFGQSSVRVAAGEFFDAVRNSQNFREAIYGFHESQKKIKIENIADIKSEGDKAPFYLNSVFDQLTPNNSSEFYSWISREAPFAYSIPAYITGLLVYYAGKLCAKTIKEHNITGIRTVHILPFGKGGRLFHWLETNPGQSVTTRYYEQCFKKAFGVGCEGITLKYRTDIVEDNKSEVSIGLVVGSELNFREETRQRTDIFAEKGLKHLNEDGQYEELDENSYINSSYFENVDRFLFPDKFSNFEEFLEIFIDFVSSKAGFLKDISALGNTSELRSMLASFIKNDSEYIKANEVKSKTNKFEYQFPLLMAEGLCYLEKVLIPEVFKN